MELIIIAIAAAAILVLLCIENFQKKDRSYIHRKGRGTKQDLAIAPVEEAIVRTTTKSETQPDIDLANTHQAKYAAPKGTFDHDGLLSFREGFYREDVPFLSDDEFRRYGNSGEDAVNTFSEQAKAAWEKYLLHQASLRKRSREYRDQYIEDLNELTNELTKEYDLDDNNQSFYYWEEDWKVNIWQSSICHKNRLDTDLKQCWLLQCFLLSQVKRIPLLFKNEQLLENPDKYLGADLNQLYPTIVCPDHFEALRTLVYDFGYGPNAFPWHLKRAEQDYLKEKPTKLYLISVDLGSLTGQERCLVWKIGITSRPQVAGKGNARYAGKYTKYIEVLRNVEYQDGSIAFMKEQVYIQLASREKSRSLGKRIDWGKLSERDRSTLGLSEIVLEGRAKKLAISLFDQITL